MKRNHLLLHLAGALLLTGARAQDYDIVIYGGTSSGVAAAVQAVRMGKTVLLIEPGKHLGGLTTGGLGATDIGNKGAIGGISREFYRRAGKHYDMDECWKFEPHAAEAIMEQFVAENKIPVVRNERLDLKSGVKKDGARIISITMESGKVFGGRIFIDATYEGDLMAKAGVSYRVGREANAEFKETLNGVQVQNAKSHQFIKAVDPYIVKGDPKSGLLPLIQAGDPGEEGSADKRVQAYNFRLCMTQAAANKIPWPKPEGYDEKRYELLLRNFEAGDLRVPYNPVMLIREKTDTNNNFAVSSDYIGMNYEYPDGDYATRRRIFEDHKNYQMGLMWTMANHPRVPDKVRSEVSRWGLAKDEFTETGGWPHQLYIREARRMFSDYIMTQHNCQGREIANDSCGMAAYGMDSHNIQRYAKDGRVWNEGDIQVHGFKPYPISYRSIVPKESECANLLVPVCVSSTHISYGSIRMEPVFMVLGQSAATAASHAIDAGVSVQKVDYKKLQERLLADKQVLSWTENTPKQSTDASKLEGVVLDDGRAQQTGAWTASSATSGFIGSGYLHDNNEGKGSKSAKFTFTAKEAGDYELRIAFTAHTNRATNVPVKVSAGDVSRGVQVNQRKAPPQPNGFFSLGAISVAAGENVVITISNENTDGYVIVDAAQMLPANAKK